MIMTAARVLAFAIAIVAVLDPSLTGPRSSRPMVSVIASDSLMDASVVERVEHVLDGQFTPVRGAMPAAAGTVLVGDRLPDDGVAGGSPLMVVAPSHRAPFIRIVGLNARNYGSDLNRFGRRTDLENKIHSKDLGSLQNNARSLQALEARFLGGDHVRSHREVRPRVLAAVIGFRLISSARCCVANYYVRSGNYSASRVRNCSDDLPAVELSPTRHCAQDCCH